MVAACFATPWATWHERRIRGKGRELTKKEQEVARALGLVEQSDIFICSVQRVPNPLYPFFYIAQKCGASCITEAAGITLGHGIYISDDSADSLALIAHELVHVAQYQRSGSISRFMVEYLYQCLMVGYFNADWEVEARRESVRALRLEHT